MKKLANIIIIILAIMSVVPNAEAKDGEWEFRFFGINPKDFENREVLPAVGGGIAAFIVHELGHIGAGALVGMNTGFDFNEFCATATDYRNKSNDAKAFFHAGGFIADSIVGTVLTIIPTTRHSDFTFGFNTFSTVNALAYGITGGVNGDHKSDIDGMDRNGWNGKVVAFSAAITSGCLSYHNLNKHKENDDDLLR